MNNASLSHEHLEIMGCFFVIESAKVTDHLIEETIDLRTGIKLRNVLTMRRKHTLKRD